MLTGFLSWWIARLQELLPKRLSQADKRRPDGIVFDTDRNGGVTTFLRRDNAEQPLGLGAAARIAGRRPLFLRPPAHAVLEKHHTIPAASRREIDQLLTHELARITPFPAEALFWRWDSKPRPGDRARIDIIITMVPKIALTGALEELAKAGLKPEFLEVGGKTLPLQTAGATTGLLRRGLAWTACGLASAAVILPFALQGIALYRTNIAIDELQPTIHQVETLRRAITAGGAEREILAKEMARTGDVVDVLATVTRILPDDTYLTDFALRDRHLTISGRSASAPRLISGLTADPAVRDAAFAAPVTRMPNQVADVFSISATVAP